MTRKIKNEKSLEKAIVGEKVSWEGYANKKIEGVYAGNYDGRRVIYGKRVVPLILVGSVPEEHLNGALIYFGEKRTWYGAITIEKEKDPIKFKMYNAIFEAGRK